MTRTPMRRSGEPADRLAAAHARLVGAVESLASGDQWRAMLAVAARFPTYSTNNILLIGIQAPSATRVCGIRTWNSLGRRVRKGEKGIAILAPCLYRARSLTADHSGPSGGNRRPAGRGADFVRRDRSGPGGAPDWHAGTGPWTEPPDRPEVESARRELHGFRVVHVFDVASTEGDPLPAVRPAELTGDAPAHLLQRLVDLTRAEGFAIERGVCQGANGYTDFAARVVRVRDDVAPVQACKTFSHELAHIRADHESRFLARYGTSIGCRAQAEVEAESIAYLVGDASGLPTADYSVPYLAGWSGGDAGVLRDAATRAIGTARGIVADLNLGASPAGHGIDAALYRPLSTEHPPPGHDPTAR